MQYVQSYQYYDSGGNVIFSAQHVHSVRNAGDVTYVSSGYQCYNWNGCSPGDYYYWNSPENHTYGTVIPVGSTWAPSLSVQDSAGNTASGNISVPLNTQTINQYEPLTCDDSSGNGYTYHDCEWYNYNYNYTYGSAYK